MKMIYYIIESHLGSVAPVTRCCIKVGTYCGRSTLEDNHSDVCSIVQL